MMLARSRKGLMLVMSVQTALKFPCLLMQVWAQRWPRKYWPYISLQWTQLRRQREYDVLEVVEAGRDRRTSRERNRAGVTPSQCDVREAISDN